MPSERFYRLPEAKQQAIREAAIQEFARVPFEKASINQIIQTADISRGSFYTYFEDKLDILRWLFKDNHVIMNQLCEESLKRSGGDYFTMLAEMFEYFTSQFESTKEMLDVAKNVFSSDKTAEHLGFRISPSSLRSLQKIPMIQKTYELINKELFKIDSVDEFLSLSTLGGTVLIFHMRQYYEYPEEVEQIRKAFYQTLDLLRFGAYRKERK